MKTKTTLLIALFAAAALSAHAQTSVPTPQSVAPNYTPPQNTANASSTLTTYSYKAPHANTWDFYLMTGAWFFDNSTMNADHVLIDRDHGHDVFADGKLKMNIDDAWYFGFGAGYNITEQFSVHVQFAYANPDYKASFNGYTINTNPAEPVVRTARGSADISTGDVAIRYDILNGKFRPFVQASIGFMYIDTGIVNGHPWANYYWNYDYYNDYYYNGYYRDTPTVDHTYFTFGATAGANYYFTKNFFGQLSYTGNWANTPHSWMYSQRINVSVGWNY
ncbi:MAG: porin family protein [Opitutaceae bacterium]|nr:porin family protein [Opitutaceae bacterium]